MARRTGVGYTSLQRHLDSQSHYSTLSTHLLSTQSATLESQLTTFTSLLSAFSTTHRRRILDSAQFRSEFTRLCSELGVDPLGGGHKGLWDRLGVSEWYLALGVQVVDVCLRLRDRSGGWVRVEEVLSEVGKLRGGQGQVTEMDLDKAILALGPLGCGYKIISTSSSVPSSSTPTSTTTTTTTTTLPAVKWVQCRPQSLDTDSFFVVSSAALSKGYLTIPGLERLRAEDGWGWQRCENAVRKAVESGLVWVDDAEEGEEQRRYYVAGLWSF